jgi:hypothetical protein
MKRSEYLESLVLPTLNLETNEWSHGSEWLSLTPEQQAELREELAEYDA